VGNNVLVPVPVAVPVDVGVPVNVLVPVVVPGNVGDSNVVVSACRVSVLMIPAGVELNKLLMKSSGDPISALELDPDPEAGCGAG